MPRRQRVRTKHALHDATIESLEWADEELRLIVRLDAHWNGGFAGPIRLVFVSVRNRADIDAWWATPEKPRQIVGLLREPDGGFLRDVDRAPLRVVCARVFDV